MVTVVVTVVVTVAVTVVDTAVDIRVDCIRPTTVATGRTSGVRTDAIITTVLPGFT